MTDLLPPAPLKIGILGAANIARAFVRGVHADALHETLVTETVNGFKAEAESFARLISEGEAAWTGATPQESFDIMSTIEALQASIRSGEWVAPKASRVFL
ncbi:hypothetical protein [Robbsia sp. KACC 23696]|uniref:hypothetical protein n=1 Tax=Robbsia sp. KACC 23696 TaxID=3149231 RepID=UPI00325BAEFB